MKCAFLSSCVLAAALLAGLTAPVLALDDVYFYKATVSLPVMRFTTANGKTKLETKILKDNDIINIALGQKLGTKVGKMVLAAGGSDDPGAAGEPASKLVIINLADKTIVGELATATALTYESKIVFPPSGTARGSAFGFTTLAVADTGASVVGKFYAATLRSAAKGTGSANAFADPYLPATAGTSTGVSGRLKFDYTDARGVAGTFDGIVLSGKISGGGKPLPIIQQ